MPKELLDGTQVSTALQHVACERVAHIVRRVLWVDSGCRERCLEHTAHDVRIVAFSVRRDEEVRAVLFGRKLWTCKVVIGAHALEREGVQGDDALFSSLAEEACLPLGEVDVLFKQSGGLRNTCAAGVPEFEQCLIAVFFRRPVARFSCMRTAAVHAQDGCHVVR